MRILHLLASPVWSGPAENVALLAQAQRELGHEVTVAVDRKRPGLTSEEPIVPRLRALGLLDESGLELSVKSTPWAIAGDLRRLRRLPVDVIHAHFSHDHLLGRWGRARHAVLVRSIHAPRSLRWSLPRADAFTVPTEREKARLGGARVRLLPALVGPEFRPPENRAALRGELGVSGEPLVGMVSTFQPSRGHALAVEALAALRGQRAGVHGLFLGDGVTLEPTRQRVAAAGLEAHVTFAGYQRGEAFVRWLQAMDVLWVLGLGNDWSARIAAQARGCGVRVVSVDEGALGLYADRLIHRPSAAELVQATLSDDRRPVTLTDRRTVARSMLELYGAAS